MEMVNDEFLDVVEALNKTGNVVLEFGLQTIHRNEEVHIQRPNNKNRIKRIIRDVSPKDCVRNIINLCIARDKPLNRFKKA